ncbi:MAG: RNA-binding protein [Anaerolineae bacterium]|nr:RNA-binding protein [Anaerolineae bacterium]
MAKKLYVGNLSYNTTKEQLHTVFSKMGDVTDIAIITDRDTGRSKGFAFVEMASEDAAQEAIKRLNGSQLDDRTLTVNEARPREERSNSYGGGRRDRY